jgi:hypothetical protein
MSKEDSGYYGKFFWVAATSFIVPLFVAYAALDKLAPTTKPTPQPDASGVDHNLWDYLLRTYVENGLVDYDGISKDYLFTTYLKQVAGARPEQLATREEKLALHCNAYNALVINGVINHKIHRNEKNVLNFTPKDAADEVHKLDSQIEALKRRRQSDPAEIERLMKQADKIRADSQFFKLKEHVFANQTISLDQLEQEMIRPVFQEPRIHVALVCAARSCPAIRGEAYVADRIEKQLQDQAQLFANDSRYVSIDHESGALKLSPILKWYATDWDAQGGYLKWLHAMVTDKTIAAKLEVAINDPSQVKFDGYDWTLNARSGSAGGTSTSGGGFGSGSVPNE